MRENFFKTKDIFRGYVETKHKKSKEPLKDRTDFKSFNEVENLEEYAGVLADNIVLIDVDDLENSNKLYKIIDELQIKCNIVETTRGKHFYFKNNNNITKNSINKNTPITIPCDCKLGSKNSYSVLKYDNRERTILKEVEDFEDIQELPKWLTPINYNMDFLNMEKGDGRNQSLFNYILTLQSNEMTKEEIRETIKIINKYVLKEPLDDKEIETILRDESFKKQLFLKGSKLLHKKVAEYMIAENNIIQIDERVHIYKDCYYSNNTRNVEIEIDKIVDNSTKRQRTEVINTLELISPSKQHSKPQYICLKNGIYDLETNELLQHNPMYIITNKIQYNYNPNAYDETVDKTLNKFCCDDQEIRLVIEEMIGYTFYRNCNFSKSFILVGNGSNGKSTLIEMINNLLGDDNICCISLKDIEVEKFRLAKVEGKLANLGDDISNQTIVNSSDFKNLVTGDKITVEEKGKKPHEIKPYCKLIFAANELPQIKDLSYGLKRRIQFIPFNATFTNQDPDYDPFIINKLTTNEAMEYLLKIGIEGLQRVLLNNGFTKSTTCEELWKQYELFNNPVLNFIEENKIINESYSDVYRSYDVWCYEAKEKAITKRKFGSEIRKLGYDTKKVKINGKTETIIIKKVTENL